MLVIMRKTNEKVTIRSGDTHIEVCVIKTCSNRVSLGFTAPQSVNFVRNEHITTDAVTSIELDTVTVCGLCNVLLFDDEDKCPHCNTLTVKYHK